MNLLTELSYNVEAMNHVVLHHAEFFSPIALFTKKLKRIVVDSSKEATQDDVLFLARKIDTFFQDWRPRPGHPYIPPSEASQNDATAVELLKLAMQIHKLPKEEFDDLTKASSINAEISSDASKNSSEVFIVHGHDDAAKAEMARLITDLGLDPIILHEQASSGKTIIEKIESYSNVGFGVVLYTPCDKGGKATDSIDLKSRARQNVVFEHGYLIGKLGRENVCALVRGNVEKPNDISGVVYVPMDAHGAWKYALADEMSAAGYEIDKNKIKT